MTTDAVVEAVAQMIRGWRHDRLVDLVNSPGDVLEKTGSDIPNEAAAIVKLVRQKDTAAALANADKRVVKIAERRKEHRDGPHIANTTAVWSGIHVDELLVAIAALRTDNAAKDAEIARHVQSNNEAQDEIDALETALEEARAALKDDTA